MNEETARRDLAAAYNILDKLNLNEGICNHLTMLVPGTETFLCIAYGMAWSEVRPHNLILVENAEDCESTAFYIHKNIHLADPSNNVCCFHTHQPYATALCCLGNGKLEMCHQNSLRFYDDIAYDNEFNGLVLDSNEGTNIADKMNGKRILFHSNHGIIVNGKSISRVMDDIIYLEKASEIQIKAMSTGLPLKIIKEETCKQFKKCFDKECGEWADKHFEAMKRTLRV